ncbi:MAG: type II CAAX prenyl endopeptidase Rce1 family protein [Candidatus Thorarchaeota archaeon]
MKEEKRKSFYSLAKFPSYEILMESQMASAGAHQAKFIEKLKRNKSYIKNQAFGLKVVFSLLFLFLPLLPLVTYFQMRENLYIHSIDTIFFISSFLFMIFLGMELMYTLMFGMISTGSFMSGNAFKWLQTLPFSKKSLKRIGVMTLFRNLDIPLIVLVLGFPIIMLIITLNIAIFFICLIVSIVNVVFSFSILLLIGEKMSILFSESKTRSKNASIIRTITMVGYFVIMFGTSFIFSWGINTVQNLFDIFTLNDPPFILILIFSLIPFLFAPAFLVSLSTLQFQVYPILIITTLTGFAISILLTWIIFRFAQRALHSAISSEVKTEKVEKREIKFELKPTSTIKAYIRKDIASSTRDIQSFMFLFFPIFYPLIMILSMIGLFNEITTSIEVILFIWSIILAIYLFIPIMLVVGFLNIEESGSSTLASLPLVPRDQAKAKILLMSSIQSISLLITSILLAILLKDFIIILLLLITLPIAWTLLLFMFVLKIKFFGQMKYKYIIEELNKEHKILKWIAMIISDFGLYMVFLITGNILISFLGITAALILLGVIGVLGLALMVFIFNRIFPKVEKIPYYKTGGFLREHVNVSTLVLIILTFIFILFFPSIIALPFSFILAQQPFIVLLFVDFFLLMGSLAFLNLVIIPYGLKLPEGKIKLKRFATVIGLRPYRPLWQELLIGISIFLIFGFTSLLTGLLFGTYNFQQNLEVLFSPPSFLSYGWFALIYMLRPAIWEEVTFRGIILSLQKKRYSQTTVILLNGIAFGLFHYVNLLFIPNVLSISLQVYFASCLGITFSYIYFKTKSIIPCIVIHYLVNAFGILFYPTSITLLNSVVYTIIGNSILPMIFMVLFVRYLFKKNENY